VTHYRSAIRAGLRAALAADPTYGAVRQISAWSQNVDAASLPIIGVVTPKEIKDLDGLKTSERETTLLVVLKRIGGEDLEDQLDDDSAAIEIVALTALSGMDLGAELMATDLTLDGSGERRVGTLTMTFRLRQWLPEPLQL
jgi:hypothetical protein